MAVSHTRTYWQSHLQELCTTKFLPNPTYEVFEHNGESIPMAPCPMSSTDAVGGSGNAPASTINLGQSWYSCVVSVGERDYETSYVYKAEENAKEKAAKKAYEALNSAT